jgi:hypothetical protein
MRLLLTSSGVFQPRHGRSTVAPGPPVAAPAVTVVAAVIAAVAAVITAVAAVITAVAAVITAAAAVITAAAAVTGLDNIGGHGSRGGGDHCRLSRGGVGHGRWRCGDSYRGSPRRHQRRDIAQSVCHSWTPPSSRN